MDIGGTRVKFAWREDGSGRIRTAWRECVYPDDPDRFARALPEQVPAAIRPAWRAGHFAVAVAGAVSGNRLGESPNLPGWHGVDIAVLCGGSATTLVVNDATAAAAGVLETGQAGNGLNTVVVTLGTGVGGAWVRDNGVYSTDQDSDFEIGHCIIQRGGRRCRCGRRGCVEAYAGGRAMTRAMRRRSGQLVPVEDLLAMADHGNKAAATVIDEAIAALATVFGNLASLLGTRRFVLAGGISAAGARLSRPVQNQARELAFGDARTLAVTCASRSGVLGAIGALRVAELGRVP